MDDEKFEFSFVQATRAVLFNMSSEGSKELLLSLLKFILKLHSFVSFMFITQK